ncbi:MAG: AAA family ATPase, partial [Ktedonobacteraceae bacterium]
MSRLHLSLLGTPEIRHDEQLLAFTTRKAMAILTYLVAEGRKFSREKITTLFWPESDIARGRGSLRLTLTYLRETLNEKAVSLSSPDSPHLIIKRDSLGFNFASEYELDLDILDSAYKYARTHAGSEGPRGNGRKTVLAQFQRAIHVYRGDFLDGFSLEDAPDFEDWLRLQRESWHRRMGTVFDCFSQFQIDGGETVDAIDSTTLWKSHDPFNEVTYQRLMQLYFTLGERNAALEIYNSCREMMAKEFGTEPTDETKTLAERIRAKPLPRGTSSTTKQSPITNSLSPFANSPLVGRATEYSLLIEAFNATQHGQARVVLLKGEAGIGKTRLATAFLGWAAANGADILQGRAFESGTHLPYQPLVESLRNRLERENAPDDLLSDTWLAEISSLLPELRDRYPDLSPPTQTETTAQARLFEAVVRLGQALAERSPVVLFVDDAQWADAASLDLLHYAGRRWQEDNISILLLLNVRIETLLSTLTLARWFSGLERDLHATSLRLGLLTLEDLNQLFEGLANVDEWSIAGQSQRASLEEFSKWLFVETRGQPFYVME